MIRIRCLSFIVVFGSLFITIFGDSDTSKSEFTWKCFKNSVEVQLFQDEPFTGSLYVEGHDEEDACRKNFKNTINATIIVQHDPCTTKNDDRVDFNLVVLPDSESKNDSTFLYHIKCDYKSDRVKAIIILRILPSTCESQVDSTKYKLSKYVMSLWKTLNNAFCDCNLNSYVNQIKSLFKSPK